MVRGGYKYIPRELQEELEDIKRQSMCRDADAFREIASNSRVARDIKGVIGYRRKGR